MIDDVVAALPLPETLVEHRGAVATLERAGIKPPTGWVKLNQRLDDYLSLKGAALEQLIANIIKPDAPPTTGPC